MRNPNLEESGHLTAWQSATWLSDAATEPERQSIQEHLIRCAECCELLMMTRQTIQSDRAIEQGPEFDGLLRLGEQAARQALPQHSVTAPPAAPLRWIDRVKAGQLAIAGQSAWSWRQSLPLAASFLFLLGLGGWWFLIYQSPLNKGLAALSQAYRDRRPVETRISALPYAPWIQTRDAGSPVTDRFARDRAAAILMNAAAEQPGAASAHALGRFYLAERKFGEAIEQFETALKSAPKDAVLLSDLAAAYLEKGKAVAQTPEPGQSLVEYAKALEYLNRAVKLNSSLLEALFNRALCLQLMYLPQQAREAWQKYLEHDANSAWAEEARRNVRLLEEQQKKTSLSRGQLYQNFLSAWQTGDEDGEWQAISQNRNPLDGGIEDRLLDDYLQASDKGTADQAKERLAALRSLGELVARRTGDRFTAALADYYGSADEQSRKLSAVGRALMKTAEVDFKQALYSEAVGTYQQARRNFVQAANGQEAALADFRVGHCYLLEMRSALAAPVFTKLSAVADKRSFHWLAFQAINALATVKDNNQEPTNAITSSVRSFEQANSLGDFTAQARALGLLTGLYRDIGRDKEALRYLERALVLVNSHAIDFVQKWNIFSNAGGVLNQLKKVETALEYRKAALEIAGFTQSPLLLSRAYAQLGNTYGDLGQNEQAIINIQQAWNYGQRLGQDKNGMSIVAHAALQLGNYNRQINNYSKAIQWYDLSGCLFEQLGQQFYQYATAKGKFLAAYGLHDDEATQRELQTVIRLFEQYRGRIVKESQRNSFFDQEQSIYDLAIEFAFVRHHDQQQAFAYAEESRGRSLLDLLHASAPAVKSDYGIDLELLPASSPLTLPQIQQALPRQTQLMQFAVLKDRLFIWVITQDRAEMREITISSQVLAALVNRYRHLVTSPANRPTTEMREAGQELYRLLIQPVESVLDERKTLCIVPDKALHYIPFQALIAPATGQYLIERFSLMYAASASAFIDCTKTARSKSGTRSERLLSVGDPAFDSALFPGLQRLPSASREATEIGKHYVFSRVLTGSEAGEQVIKRDLANVEIAHLATHYLPNQSSLMASQLVLAKNKTALADGGLQTAEIYQLKMPSTRLVVLSACQTGIEQNLGGEGALSLVRPFIAAKVPLVIASLWPVDSDATADLMIEFHRQRRQFNKSTVEALRQAQLSLLQAGNQQRSAPYYWASFNLFGGYAEF